MTMGFEDRIFKSLQLWVFVKLSRLTLQNTTEVIGTMACIVKLSA